MAKRGRIMRDPTAGPGLVIVEGRQHPFGLEGVWRSDVLPRPGIVVDVEFDDAGRISAIVAVPEVRLAREQAEAAIALATTTGQGLLARVGLRQLAALGLLALGWFWLAALEVDASPLGQWQVTLWQSLGALTAGEPLDAGRIAMLPGAGIFGLAAVLGLAAPLLAQFWRDRRAQLAALLPLAFTLMTALPLARLARESTEPSQVVSLGAGLYVSLLAGAYVAMGGLRRYLVAKARDAAVYYEKE